MVFQKLRKDLEAQKWKTIMTPQGRTDVEVKRECPLTCVPLKCESQLFSFHTATGHAG